MVDLSTYVRVGRYDLPVPNGSNAPVGSQLAEEVSAVTYNKDTDTLFVVGDEGTSIVQISKTGELVDSMSLGSGAFDDTEGLTYVGNGQFVMVEERTRSAILFTYEADGTLTRDETQIVKLGTTVGNIGFEGISFDPLTDGYIIVKEKDPTSVFQTDVDFDAGTATNGSPSTENATNLFDPAGLGVVDIADVFALSNVNSGDDTILILSQESARILEVDRAGNILSVMNLFSGSSDISAVEQGHEGITMDDDGFIYVVSENGGGVGHPQVWVYAPATDPNEAPTAISLVDELPSIAENLNTDARVKIADIAITDDGQGVNNFTVTGADAAHFEVDNTGVYLKAGTELDYETKDSFSFTVNVDDPDLGSNPDASTSYTLEITDVDEGDGGNSGLFISEVAPWSSGDSPVGADWFEVTNGGTGAVDITGWKVDDDSASSSAAVALSGVTSIAAGESVIFVNGGSTAVTAFIENWFGGVLPSGVQIGTYEGSGIGLSTSGDEVNLFNAGGILQASIGFGASTTGRTFDNAAGIDGGDVTTLSLGGRNGAVVAGANDEVGSPGTVGNLFVSEVAPWSSGTPVGFDWFEVTNGTASAIDLTGWKVDDSAPTFATAVALNGISSIAAGETVIFLNSANPSAAIQTFVDTWFGGTAPAGLQFGTYTGSGIGLSAGSDGDAVNLYDGNGNLRASVSFGDSGSALTSFENPNGLDGIALTARSTIGADSAAFAAANASTQIGSPGEVLATNSNPVATDDVLSDHSGSGSRTISFADLLANDSAGPNEAGQTLTITGVSNAVGGTVAIVGTDVVFTPTSGFSGEARFDYVVRDNGTSYGVADARTDTGSVSFDITAETNAPSFTSASAFNAAENQTVAGTLTATDPQEDTVTYSIVGGADQSLFSVNAQTGVLSFLTAPNFEAPADANHDNAYVLDVRASDGTNSTNQTITVNVTDVAERAEIYITEVAPWSSSSPAGADWFEVTNKGSTAIDLTGWKVDDSSNSFASAVALSGITSIAAGQSVIFLEAAAGQSATTITSFVDTWFNGTAPAGVQIGTYTGSGIGLSTSGDAVNLYDAGGTLQANVTFGASPAGPTFQTFNNAAAANNANITTLSAVDVNGGFRASDDVNEIGSPGSIGRLFVSEVAPGSSNTSVGADWFEVTNSTASAINISGWKVDDSSATFGSALALNGITTIAAGESVIFIESANPTEAIAAFVDTWFGGTAPAGLQFGTYSGSGIGLSGSGDAVNLYNASGVLQASVSFGATALATVDNSTALNGVTVTTISGVGFNGAFATDDEQVGSPGEVTTNDAPVAADDDAAVVEDDSISGDLLTNDSDPQSYDTIALLSVAGRAIDGSTEIQGLYGTLTIDADGGYSYAADGDRADTLADGAEVVDAFDYIIDDGNGGRATATLSVTVTGINDTVVMTLPPTQVAYEGDDADEAITTGDGDNSIFGMGGADVIQSGLGDDSLAGGAGNDSIMGGAGNNYLFGGSMDGSASEGGNDTLIGGGGADHIYGNSVSGAGNDTDGEDLIETGDGVNYATGAAGDDTITGGGGRDRIQGGADNDSLFGGDGTDRINGNQGEDTIHGGDGNDVLRGGKDDDLLFGDGGNDVLTGDLGNDTLVAGAGVDIMTGGTGADIFDLSGVDAGNFDTPGFYTAITDFQQGTDLIRLAYTVDAGDVLQGGSFGTVASARTAAQQQLIDHAGTEDVVAARVGSTTYLFYNAEGTADQITGILALFSTTPGSIDQSDFDLVLG